MSWPTIPDFPPITLTREESLVLLLASIAREEIALAHVVNAEAEKLEYVSGTLGQEAPPSLDAVLEVQASARRVLDAILLKEVQLQLKLGKAKELLLRDDSTVEAQNPSSNASR
ncbi:MAG: hypothetical protein BAA04_02320 [Firmicutes bacterium ZCTH02-B6]|nr:MAG: hypothetical protein BAA04_02320 [Firmicutes bacterium ZCTH02-B6]